MGGVFSNGFTSFWRNSNVKIVMTGLDAAGKTTVLYKMKLGEVVTTIPTIGFNVESVKANGTEFVMWDVGGRSGIRGLEKYYMADMDAQVFVVDCNDKDRLDEVKDLLERTISMVGEIEKEKPLCPIAILANKQDLPQSIGPGNCGCYMYKLTTTVNLKGSFSLCLFWLALLQRSSPRDLIFRQ
eukprot:m.52570 g.52570  ORF g.52570 m.52570 type:complete len:184 (+) comp11001_c2_seq3:180-731(+)